ncbi:DUF6531 domain-containing protein [Stenotrophomonas rhizophila]|uniref:DUF6531 domain-containing protein n=1 Tax=Stenotrophomonas rhizophila TaxID=216778 RepID=UPI001E282C4B|nr:DUF6531 domain-containing protein [Stenotrophomonas rhizophila]MCC7634428.1 type IV secretion protein Rhs [Stenotrophomonas rhizophila]MCC7663826.1 type IV secretion protein Rhs [Stenotrophomonas rhizophila]
MLLLVPLSFAPAGVRAVEHVPGSTPTTNWGTIEVRPPIDHQYIGGGGGWWYGYGSGGRPGGRDPGLGGGGGLPSETTKEQETDDRTNECPQIAGNPVVLYTGNKVEAELDFTSGGEMGLYLQRRYNHHWSATGLFGSHWLSNLDYSLAFTRAKDMAWVQWPDGRRIKFLRDSSNARWNEDKPQPRLHFVRNSDSTYTLRNEDHGVEIYNADGYIIERRNRQGVRWTFAYDNKYLQRVTHSSGRSMQFVWSNGEVSAVTDPAGNIYRYSYTADVFGAGRGRLATTTLPGAPDTTISYHYEDPRFPGALTGKSFNGARYSTFAYDAAKRATLSEHAGGVERHTFSYVVETEQQVTPPPAPIRPGGVKGNEETGWCEYKPGFGYICYEPRFAPGGQLLRAAQTKSRPVKINVTQTNPLGRSTVHAFNDGKLVSVTGLASPHCAASYKERSYDANGHPDLVHDFADNLTDLDYDAQGYLLRQVEAVGSSAERTTTYEWDQTDNHLLKATVHGLRETTYTYEERGNLASVTVVNLGTGGVQGQQRSTHYRYGYHGNGMKAWITEDGPLAQDEITTHYSEQGDLLSIGNALGHSTTYSNHNGLGQPGRITGANGDVTELTHDGRGRLVVQRLSMGNDWATTAMGYDGAGNLASVTHPDGVTVRYEYDAARRLLHQVQPHGDGTYAWARYGYDVASNLIRSEVLSTDYPPGSTVIGAIDEVSQDGSWNGFLRGWACSTGSKTSIQVDAYADGGTYLGSSQANLASEPAVAAACQANGSAYRFHMPITLQQRQQLGGRSVTVYGLSPLGGAHNRAIGNSGLFTIPTATVIGDIGGVTQDADWNYFVEGWACSVGVDTPVDVHLYVGGPAGAGTFALAGTANLPTDGSIASACQARGNAYGFRLPLDAGLRHTHGNQAIHIHAISPVGQPHLTINRSGSHAVPPVVLSAEFVGFSIAPGHIFNGDAGNMTIHVRNSGNVVWHGNTRLAWWIWQTSQRNYSFLGSPVAPGSVATFTQDIWPVHNGNGVATFRYIAQMSTDGNTWGPQSQADVNVENDEGWCPPNKPYCNIPQVAEPTDDPQPPQGGR